MRALLAIQVALVLTGTFSSDALAQKSNYTLREVMIPMRDGVCLQTSIVIRRDLANAKLPILLTRTAYGVPSQSTLDQEVAQHGPQWLPTMLQELAKDGYIFVWQNVRGRFKSEGTFELTSRYDPANPAQPNEVNDSWDTVEWLVKNVAECNGEVGLTGISYGGMTAGIALLHPHPAVKAVSEQGSWADQWMNDDFHRYGALRESYAFEYSVYVQADKNRNTNASFDQYDTFSWYLQRGALGNLAGGSGAVLPFWKAIQEHPDRDAFWQKEAWVDQLHGTSVPLLNVAGFWDQEDPWGPWQIFRHAQDRGLGRDDFMVAGPWFHGAWSREQTGTRIGRMDLGGHSTSLEFRRDIEARFFRHYLHGINDVLPGKVITFQTGRNVWKYHHEWPPKNTRPRAMYLHGDGSLSFQAPAGDEKPFREYISDPANPVPYRPRPIPPTYADSSWRTWETEDQRFVDHRPDVLTYVSDPLEHDLSVTGDIAAELMASTSGTDSDFVVKLIDVFPETGAKDAAGYRESTNGMQMPIAMEVRRGRYLDSYDRPAPLKPNQVRLWEVPLRPHDHVFLKGHRVMVQVQSTWFPVIDRNPQQFVPSIYKARLADYIIATERVYSSTGNPSRILLPVMEDN